jgi:hypothetical protein
MQGPLKCLFESIANVNLIAKGEELPHFDVHCPLLSLPRAFGTTAGTIPASIPYLRPDPLRVRKWAGRLAPGFRIGIAWQGARRIEIDRERSFPLQLFAPLAAIPGVTLISLQKHAGAEQLDDMPSDMRVQHFGEELDAGPDAFVDTAAVMMSLDLVVTSDTAIAHLAGALGRPVWIALKHMPDWRWMLDRDDTPWYPTARLFRQKRRADWIEVFERIAVEVTRTAANKPAAEGQGAV